MCRSFQTSPRRLRLQLCEVDGEWIAYEEEGRDDELMMMMRKGCGFLHHHHDEISSLSIGTFGTLILWNFWNFWKGSLHFVDLRGKK